MICNRNSGKIEVDFDKAGVLEPIEARFEYKKGKYDTFYCKFDSEIALEVYRDLNDGLDEIQRAIVKINGLPIRAMYYEPEFMKIGGTSESDQYYGFLELHDLHEHLKSGKVHYNPNNTTVKETFEEIYKSRKDNDIFTGLEIGNIGEEVEFDYPEDLFKFDLGKYNPWGGEGNFDIAYPMNFDGDSPLKSLEKAKKEHGVDTHISSDGKLVVAKYSGEPGAASNEFLNWNASNIGKNVDLHIKNSAFGNNAEKIQQIELKGPMISEEDIVVRQERIRKYIDFTEDFEEYRLTITVSNPNVRNGHVLSRQINNINAAEDDLIELGKSDYQAAELATGSGSITVKEGQDLERAKKAPDVVEKAKQVPNIGDKITIKETAPNCNTSFNYQPNQKYRVSGVEHKFSPTHEMVISLIRPMTSREDLNVDVNLFATKEKQDYTYKEIYGYEIGEKPTSTRTNTNVTF